MLTYAICKDLVMKSGDACVCALDCKHDRKQRPLKMHQWLVDIRLIKGLNNKQGRVYTANVRYTSSNGEPTEQAVVLKHFNQAVLYEHAKREFMAGYYLNALKLPMFVESYVCFYRKSGPYNLTRFIDGNSFKSVMPKMTRQQFISLTMQLCIGLEMAQSTYRFGHYDLHLENVLLNFSTKKTQILFDQYHVSFSNCWIPVIIDFGMSCGTLGSHHWGIKNLEKKGIFDQLRPGYDMFVFFLYCYQEPGKFAFADVVEKVLVKFYGHNVATPRQYLATLARGGDRKTPKQLFEFLNRLSTHVMVQPRLLYALEPPCDTEDRQVDSYVDQTYYRVLGHHTIDSDLISFRSKNLEYKVNMYYKIHHTSLVSLYENWLKSFKPQLNRYWKQKDRKEAEDRIKWLLPVTAVASAV